MHQNEAEDVPLSPGAESQYYRLDKCILSLYVFLSRDESDSLLNEMMQSFTSSFFAAMRKDSRETWSTCDFTDFQEEEEHRKAALKL